MKLEENDTRRTSIEASVASSVGSSYSKDGNKSAAHRSRMRSTLTLARGILHGVSDDSTIENLDSINKDLGVPDQSVSTQATTMYNKRHLSPLQLRLAKVVDSNPYQLLLTLLVLVNVALVIVETDHEARGSEQNPYDFFWWVNFLLLICFLVDVLGRMAVFTPRVFFHRPTNQLEFFIVLADVLAFSLSMLLDRIPSASVLRTLVRLARLAKSTKLVFLFPELGIMLTSLVGALRSLLWGCILLSFMVIIYAVTAVRIIHPINLEVEALGIYEDCPKCHKAFESVWSATLIIVQQNVLGDGWGDITIPIVTHAPWTAVFFFLTLSSIQLMVMNIILAMVVESAEQAREQNSEVAVKRKQTKEKQEREAAKKKLIRLCKELDTENTGMMQLEQLVQGIKCNEELRGILAKMDVTEYDLEDVWDILQDENSDEISCEGFADHLHKMKGTSDHTLLIFIRHLVASLPRKVNNMVELLKTDLQESTGMHSSDYVPVQADRIHCAPDTVSDAKLSFANASANQTVFEPSDLEFMEQLDGGWKRQLEASLARIEEMLKMCMRFGNHPPSVSTATTVVVNSNPSASLSLPLQPALQEHSAILRDAITSQAYDQRHSPVLRPDRKQSRESSQASPVLAHKGSSKIAL